MSLQLIKGESLMETKEFFKQVFSFFRALARLVLLTIIFFIDGFHNVLFARREICDYEYIFNYLSADEDKISYIEKLNGHIDDVEDDVFFDIDDLGDEGYGPKN